MQEKDQYDQDFHTSTIDDQVEKKFRQSAAEEAATPSNSAFDDHFQETAPPPVQPPDPPELQAGREASPAAPKGESLDEHFQEVAPPPAHPEPPVNREMPSVPPQEDARGHFQEPVSPPPFSRADGAVSPPPPGFQQPVRPPFSPQPPPYQQVPGRGSQPPFTAQQSCWQNTYSPSGGPNTNFSPQGQPGQVPPQAGYPPYSPPPGTPNQPYYGGVQANPNQPVGGQPFGAAPTPPPAYPPPYTYIPPKPPEPPEAAEHRSVLKKISSHIGLSLLAVTIVSFVLAFLIEGVLTAILVANQKVGDITSFSVFSDSTVLWAIQLVVMLVADLTGVLIFWRLSRLPMKTFFAKPVDGVENTVKGTVVFYGVMLVGLLVVNIVVQLFYSLFHTVPYTPDFSVSASEPLALVFYLLACCVVAPILEELLFRGFILRSLQKFGNVFAILISGILFGLFHGNLQQAIPTALGGMVLAFIAIRSNSLIPCIIAHFFNNALSSAEMIFAQYYPEEITNLVMILIWAVMIILAVVVVLVSFRSAKIKDGYRGLSAGKRIGTLLSSPAMIILLVLVVLQFLFTFIV